MNLSADLDVSRHSAARIVCLLLPSFFSSFRSSVLTSDLITNRHYDIVNIISFLYAYFTVLTLAFLLFHSRGAPAEDRPLSTSRFPSTRSTKPTSRSSSLVKASRAAGRSGDGKDRGGLRVCRRGGSNVPRFQFLFLVLPMTRERSFWSAMNSLQSGWSRLSAAGEETRPFDHKFGRRSASERRGSSRLAVRF